MSNQKRASLGLDDETTQDIFQEKQIDIEEVIGNGQVFVQPTPQQQAKIYKEAEKIGFVSRQPKKRRKVSPYTAQFGGKCREGMKELFQDIGDHLGYYYTQTLEKAILALLEKENLKEFEKRYREIVK